MTQYMLKTAAALPANHTDTSQAAAAAAQPSAAGDRAAILALLEKHPQGLTQDRIAKYTGIKLQTVCARINDLGTTGDVVAYATRGINLSGNAATRFALPEAVALHARDHNWPTPMNRRERAAALTAAHARISELEKSINALSASVAHLEQYLSTQNRG